MTEAEELQAENARIRAAGADLAHWLQAWVNDHPGQQWCYSEAALARWRALGGPTPERGEDSPA